MSAYRHSRGGQAPGGKTTVPADAGRVRRDLARHSGQPRRAAYDVLAAVEDREAYANLMLPGLLAERSITGRDAAFATELAYGTLRGQGTYDAVLAACSDRPLARLDPPVRHVLRLGAHQLLATRVGAHAAVATSVDLVKSVAGPRASGYVNAVLRRVATRDLDAWLTIVAPDPVTDPDGYLAIRHSHPRWIVAAFRDALGEQGAAELEAALAAGNVRPHVTLATFPGGPPPAAVMPDDATPGRWSPYAFTLAAGDPSPLVASGAAAVQDEASQLAALALTRVPLVPPAGDRGELWLDLCAGPGGKARLLRGLAAAPPAAASPTGTASPTGAAAPRAALIAAELHPHRAALVRSALDRVPGQPAPSEVIVADGTRPPWPDGRFDRVLVDAPCSGLGALRRRPEARWRKSQDDLPALAAGQRALLRSALAACRPGGVVAYVTCSPVPAETRDVVAAVARDVPGTEILDAPAVLSEVPDIRSPSPLLAQLWPQRHGTDAIFIALLRRSTQ
jgi:16S rRNA (cytosine967-C5)-methyltransferase